MFLSEALQEQAALEAERYREQATAASEPEKQEDPQVGSSRFAALRRMSGGGRGRWPIAVGYALLSSGIALALDVGGVLFSPLLILAWLWIVSAPMLTVSFYRARAQNDRLSAGFAARLGLLTGLLVVVSCAIVFTLALVLERFVLHNASIDAQMALFLSQIRAQYGNAAEPMLRLMGIPEFRVGLLLWTFSFTAGIYLVLSALTAGFAGMMLGRRRAA